MVASRVASSSRRFCGDSTPLEAIQSAIADPVEVVEVPDVRMLSHHRLECVEVVPVAHTNGITAFPVGTMRSSCIVRGPESACPSETSAASTVNSRMTLMLGVHRRPAGFVGVFAPPLVSVAERDSDPGPSE
jgi:hypothetical protein